MLTKPFEIAERYIQLRTRCMPPSWGDTAILCNELVLGPMISLVFLFLGSTDPIMIFSAITRTYSAWCEWEEFHSLRSVMQDMYLHVALHGGPQISTNNPMYLPYVYADAMVRLG